MLDRALVQAMVDSLGAEQDLRHRTYARLLECAENCLKGDVNATFLKAADRPLFHEWAAGQSIRYIIVSCEADYVVLTKRIEERHQSHVDLSEGDIAALDRQLQHIEPLSADEPLHVVSVDTNQVQAYEKSLAAIQSGLASSTYEIAAGVSLQRRSRSS